MKVEIKDINKYLSLKSKIIVTGKYSVSVGGKILSKFKDTCFKKLKKLREKIHPIDTLKNITMPTEDEKQEEIDKKIKKTEEKIEELTDLIGYMEDDEEYRVGTKQCYLEESKKKLEELKDKKIKITEQGLGVFALGKITLLGLGKKVKKLWDDRKNKTSTETSDIEDAKATLKANAEELIALKKEEKELLEKYPDLDSNKIKSVIAIKKPDEKLKNKIFNSANFKKAIATLALFTTIVIGSKSCSNEPVKKSDYDNNEPNTTVSEVVNNEETVEKIEIDEKKNVKLGDYVKIDDNSKIFSNSEMNASYGIIGTNGYTSETLFKVNAITYVDSNNIEKTFNLVQQNDSNRTRIEKEHQNYIDNNQNLKIKNVHIIPCDDLGIPIYSDTRNSGLGGWVNTNNTDMQIINNNQVFMDTYQSLGGKKI